MNYEGWQAELPQEEQPQEREETKTVAATAVKQEDGPELDIPDLPDHEEENPVFSGHDESTITVQHGLTIPEVKVNDESAE